MHRFWETIIQPVLEVTNARHIIEIGTEFGKNTEKILEYCQKNQATLYTIDPAPAFDVKTFENRYDGQFHFYKSLSLNAIPLIDKFDVILIDGDHNWYTVYHELKLIEKQCNKKNILFPLILFHDTGWPYARRDLYYNPDQIPEIFRKPYQQKGMKPDSPELVDTGGLNPDLNNAIHENDLKNGVLTAIEDFKDETDLKLTFLNISGLHGFGVLYPDHYKEKNQAFISFIQQFSFSILAKKHIDKIELDRINHMVGMSDAFSEINSLKTTLNCTIAELNNAAKREKSLKDALKSEMSMRKEKENEISILKQENNNLNEHNNLLEQETQKQAGEYRGIIERLNHGINELLASRRWRIAVAVGELFRRLRFLPKVQMVEDYLTKEIEQYSQWNPETIDFESGELETEKVHKTVIKKKIINPFIVNQLDDTHQKQNQDNQLIASGTSLDIKNYKSHFSELLSDDKKLKKVLTSVALHTIYILPVPDENDHLIIKRAFSLRQMGLNAQVAIQEEYRTYFFNTYSKMNELEENLFYVFDNEEELITYGQSFNIAACIESNGFSLAKKLIASDKSVTPVVYVFDDHSTFNPENDFNDIFLLDSIIIFKAQNSEWDEKLLKLGDMETHEIDAAFSRTPDDIVENTLTGLVDTREKLISEVLILINKWNLNFQTKRIGYTDQVTSAESRKTRIGSLMESDNLETAIASFFLRHYLPFTHETFEEQFEFIPYTQKDMFTCDTDILIVSRVAIPDESSAVALLKHCQKRGIQTVYETDDDLFGLPEHQIGAGYYKERIPAAKLFAEYSNIVLASSDRLRKSLLTYNNNVIAVPNAHDERLWKTPKLGFKDQSIDENFTVRILYMGTYTHLKDLLIVEKAITKLIEKWGEKIAFDVIGITEKQNQFSWINPIPIPNGNYPAFVKWLCSHSNWSIGIAPLEETEFNRCKSYIKYLDYAGLGLVPVCSDFTPYQGVIKSGHNGVLVKNNTQSWFDALDRLIADTAYRNKIADTAYNEYLTSYTLKKEVHNWMNAFETLIR